MAVILLKRGTRAQLDAAALVGQLRDGEPYLITDESRIAVGTSATTYDETGRHAELAGIAQESTLGLVAGLLQRIWNQLTDPPGFDMAQNRARVTAALESGTVTTVTTVSNIAAQGGTQAQLLALAADEQAWHALMRTKIT